MKVVVAEHLGMCFGVKDAIDLTLELAAQGPLTVLGDLVHNDDVVARMEAAGVGRAHDAAAIATRGVLLTAHGTASSVKADLRARGHLVHDAACPLVTRAHNALRKLAADGRHPVVIGSPAHVEVRGMTADFAAFNVIASVDDIGRLADKPLLGIVAQTTQPLEFVLDMVAAIAERFPSADLRFVDTVCQPTKDRQDAARRLVLSCDAVVVVGGPDSNNSRKLAEMAHKFGKRGYQVARAAELRPEWFASVETVGLTAGTSTPDDAIAEVRCWLEAFEATPKSRAA